VANAKRPKVILRALPISARYFWQDTHSKQLALVVKDKRSMAALKKLTDNTMIAMALNEFIVS
jgi:hypothetical protein